jgi:flagellar assembly protein FliH
MSCKLFESDETPAAPLVWRTASAVVPQKAPGPPPDNAAELRAQAAQLQHEYEQRIRQAHAAGVKEGEAAGRARATAEIQPVIERLARAMEEVAGLRASLRAEAEADLVHLSLAIARRVLRREIAIDPEALHGLVLGALRKLQGQEIARVRVHPSHAVAITKCLQENLNADKIEVIADPSREIGAVIFETQRGNLDASVDSQLQEIERGLADRLTRPAAATERSA